MPIGYDTGAGPGFAPDLDGLADRWRDWTDWLDDTKDDVLEAVWGWKERLIDIAEWIVETVAQIYSVPVYGFRTAADERTCPECAPWHGASWADDQPALIPLPPLHVNCRCTVQQVGTEWRTRWVEEWRLRWRTESLWEWKITGWE
jgi:hypothetical protein